MYDPQVGGPDQMTRYGVYNAAGFSEETKNYIERMVLGSGKRTVGKGALTNVVTGFQSRKNGVRHNLESHTCELIFAYELELDPDVIGYYTQIPCSGVQRLKPDGRRHISSAHLDFLVFKRSSVELVECKQIHWLHERLAMDQTDWSLSGKKWTHAPYERWAEERGIAFQVWVGPTHPAIYSQNLAATYDVLHIEPQAYELRLCEAATKCLERGPLSLSQLQDLIPSFSARIGLMLIASRQAFGPIRSVSICKEQNFILSRDGDQIVDLEKSQLGSAAMRMGSLPPLENLLLRASPADLERARQRLKRVQEVEEGLQLPSRRTKWIARQVQTARVAGKSSLEACLTSYHRSGNRIPRISDEHVSLIEQVVKKYWNSGKVAKACDLEQVYENECERLGLPIAGRSRLNKERRAQSPSRLALVTGGLRSYQSKRPNSDPRFTSTAPAGFGSLAHIDSTPIDMRFASIDDSQPGPLKLNANLYVASDGATNFPLAYALIFGPSRTEGLAVLFRDMVRRNGFLPRMVHVDRGPENTSKWMQAFCEGNIGVRFSPTAGSAWNQPAETIARYVNEQVSHKLFGSTLPDKYGRSIDGRYKSLKTARMQFSEVYALIEWFIYDNLVHIPLVRGGSPNELKKEALERIGLLGQPRTIDESFLIQTSLPLARTPAVTPRCSMRLDEGSYTSDEFRESFRLGKKILEVRIDCEDPALLYVRTTEKWLKLFSRRIQTTSNDQIAERLFDLCIGSHARSISRREKEKLATKRRDRIELAKQASVIRGNIAAASLPPPELIVSKPKEIAPSFAGALYDEGEL